MIEPGQAAAHLARMRRSYETAGLREEDLADTWLAQFERWLADAVDAGSPEANATVLATVDASGRPSARTVLLKGVGERGFVLYTNLRSRKARELAANPHAALAFSWLDVHRQVTVRGAAEPVDAAEADAYFASRPPGSQVAAHASPQSEPIASRSVLEDAFAEAQRRLGQGPIPRPEHWGGLRIVPEEVEFWQGRRNRLHDRLRFRRTPGGWIVERLAP